VSGFMSSENENPAGSKFRLGRRGMSMTVAVVVMVVVIVVVGGAGYAALASISGSGTKTITTCAPPTSPICQSASGLYDVVLTVPYTAGFGQALTTLAQSQSVPGTVGVSGGEAVNQYAIYWGDGANYSGTAPTANHIYTTMGWYIISAQALVGTTWHQGPKSLFPIDVTQNVLAASSGFYPTVVATFSNGSSAATQFGWLSGSGSVSVSLTYTANSTANGYTDVAPTLSVPAGSTQSGLVSKPTSVSATYAFTTPGLYYINMVGKINGPASAILYQNYTWTVYVAPAGISPGCASCSAGGSSSMKSPHMGEATFQVNAAGGATSEDPSVSYDTVSAEALWNVYQTLVAYNGSSTTSWVPEASLCVPGPGCAAMFGGNTLIQNNASNGEQEFFTFPIDPNAHFYDPSTKVSWSVYPSDVMFSLSRSCGFANLPSVGSEPGWIQCQSLLNPGSGTWDGGIHGAYNNTPGNVLGSMIVNDTKYCPSNVMAKSNGCITFNVWGLGITWPFFMELVSDPMGSAVEPCGWFTFSSAGVPGFAGTGAPKGDGPCYLPDGGTTTNNSAWTTYLAGLNTNSGMISWDTFEELAFGAPAIQPGVQWSLVGSGPYYATSFDRASGYSLAQNPAYLAPTGCAGKPGCEPTPGATNYINKVVVEYNPSTTIGVEQYKSGLTDLASIQPSDTPQVLSLIASNKIGAFTLPTLIIGFLPFAIEFNPAAAKTLDPNVLNIPGDFFSYVGLREFLVNAYPYTTTENTIWTTDGIQYGFNFGGAIPVNMGNYYPTNISWPVGDPVSSASTVGSAGWWWAQITNSASPYYDKELAGSSAICSTSSPCQFAVIGEKGQTAVDQIIQDYMPFISSLSGGELEPNTFDVTFTQLVIYSLSALPGQGALPFYNLAWAPDYPDPTDYMTPLYYPNATYTGGDAVEEGLLNYVCTSNSALSGTPPTTLKSEAALFFWAHQTGVPNACQGNAYSGMEWGMTYAAGLPSGPERVLIYNVVEHIANMLALYVYYDQSNSVITYASWLAPASLNTNPTIGAAGDNTWYTLNGNGVICTSATASTYC